MLDMILKNISTTPPKLIWYLVEFKAKVLRVTNNVEGLAFMATQYKSGFLRYLVVKEIEKLSNIKTASKILIDVFHNEARHNNIGDSSCSVAFYYLTEHGVCPPDIQASFAVHHNKLDLAVSAGEASVDLLVPMLESEAYWRVLDVASALAKIGSPRAIPHLIHALERFYKTTVYEDDGGGWFVTDDSMKERLSNHIASFGEVALKDLIHKQEGADPTTSKYIQRTIDLIEKRVKVRDGYIIP